MQPIRVLVSIALAAGLSTPALASGSAFTLHLDQPGYAPHEAVDFTVMGAPGQFGFLLFDSDTTPTTLMPGLTVDIGFSANYFAAPVLLPPSGVLTMPYSHDCVRSGVLMGIGGMVQVQAVSLDPVDASLCVSNQVTLDATDSYGYCKPCDECKGGVVAMTVRYLGTAPAYVEATKAGDLTETYFAGNLAPYETFSFIGVGPDNKLAKDLELLVDGVPGDKIHTSCSQPIGPGSVFGPFLVLEAASKDKGNVCPESQTSGDDCTAGKPLMLAFKYTGEDCSASSHSQDPAKAPCSGDPADAASVQIQVIGKHGPVFDGTVALDQTFVVDPMLFGIDHFDANMDVVISDPAGNQLQTLSFHASCSQPLAVGNVFGGIELVTFVPKP